jgi:endonuclease-3
MKPADRVELFTRLRAANPSPTTELEYTTPFELLAAVLLSAQATDKGVNIATRRLFPVANTPAAILALGVEGLEARIRTIGLYRSKAKHLIEACRILVDEHDGEVPRDRASLERLPGVGRKTANVVLNTAFGEPTMAVDTHIFRVSNRLGLAPGKTPLAVEEGLLKTVPKEFLQDAHHWLILHGRYVCKALKPECWRCPVSDLCRYRPKTPAPGTLAAKPKAKAKAEPTSKPAPKPASKPAAKPAPKPAAKPAPPPAARRRRDVQPES